MYKENFIQSVNISKRKIAPKGIVLHHIYLNEQDTIDILTKSSGKLSTGEWFKGVSAHCIGWKDGSRTKLAHDTDRTWHAGYSEFQGLTSCNNFMLGYEFHYNSNKEVITQDQLGSFLEWFIPRKEKYDIQLDFVVDHRMIRNNFIEKYCSDVNGKAYYNGKYVSRKVDLNPVEYEKVMTLIKQLY